METDSRCCPHIDGNDPRCGSRFTLGGVEDMFSFCCAGFHGCAMFHRINMEVKFRATVGDERAAAFIRDRRPPAIMQVTSNGRNLSLRSTAS